MKYFEGLKTSDGLHCSWDSKGWAYRPSPSNLLLAATARQHRAPTARTALNASLRVQNGRSEPRTLSPFAKQLLTKNSHPEASGVANADQHETRQLTCLWNLIVKKIVHHLQE